jgi:hypothetical protein
MVYSDGTNVVDTAFTEVSSDYSPQLSGILDTNGNDIIIDNGGAIEDDSNNAAASTGPEISATGDDTNIDLKLTPKGSGNLVFDGIKFPNADGTVDQILTTNGSGNLSFVDNTGGTSWQAVKTTGFTGAAGEGYFCDTTSAAFTATLPAGTLGDEISFIDYAGTFDTNNLTIAPNGAEKIQGSAASLTVSVERAGLTLVYTDGTQGWLLKDK